MNTINGPTADIHQGRNVLFSLSIAVAVLALDFATGRHVEFPLLFALPVGLAAWRARRLLALTLSLCLPLVRTGFHYVWRDLQNIPVLLVNAVITMVALMAYAYLIDRTAWQTRALEKKVKELEGILPICARCKRIRNDMGQYEEIEQYISEHSEASFSHGLCGACAKELYPGFTPED